MSTDGSVLDLTRGGSGAATFRVGLEEQREGLPAGCFELGNGSSQGLELHDVFTPGAQESVLGLEYRQESGLSGGERFPSKIEARLSERKEFLLVQMNGVTRQRVPRVCSADLLGGQRSEPLETTLCLS